MKKSTKFFVFGGLICLLLGAVIMIITGAAGGMTLVYDLMHNYNIRKVDFATDILDDFDNYDFDCLYGTEEISVSENNISSVYIAVLGGEIEILEGEDDKIRISAKDGFDTQYTINSGRLAIKDENDWLVNGDGRKVTVYLPSNLSFDSIEISVGGGELEASALNAKEIVLDVGAGEATVEKLTADYLEVNVGAGEISIERGQVAKDAKMNVGMGEIDWNGCVQGNAELRCGIGELDFYGRDMNFQDYDYDMNCGAGSIRIMGKEYSGVGFSKHIDHGSSKMINIDCGMGEIDITFSKDR